MDHNSTKGGAGVLNFYSYNVRGLRQASKRNKIFEYLNQNTNGIIFLQECHSTPNDEITWKKHYNGKFYYSHGTSNARGTMIIIPDKISTTISKYIADPNGRYIILEGKFDDKQLTLINTYLPTQDKPKEQCRVIDEIIPHITENIHKTIWGGDFNVYMEPDKDHYKHNKNRPKSETVIKIEEILEQWNMCDIFRIQNPDSISNTWRCNSHKGLKQSKLDYWFVPKSFQFITKVCDVYPSILSDHSIIRMTISNTKDTVKGRGTWKFNLSLLNDQEYIKKINDLLEHCIEKYKDVKDKGLKWDVIKSEIRGTTISHASYRAKSKRELEANLIQNIQKLEEDVSKEPNENNLLELLTDKKELEQIVAERTRGIQIRAKCTHLECNETNSKYFLSVEKSNNDSKNMTTLIKDDGTETTEIKEIIEEQKKFYELLYRDTDDLPNEFTDNATKYFLNSDIKIQGLADEDKEELECPITIEEISKAIKDLATNKSPGTDGLSSEFYVYFWPQIQNLVWESINYAIENNRLSIDQRRGILTLIPKKDKDSKYVKNWRPLSLLNTDYKIYAKTLATRLQKVMDEIIDYDQSGCIKGRSTFSNLRSTIDIINYTEKLNLPGILAFIDFEKAFDTVKWPFIYKVFHKMNFGPYFIKCVKILYNDIMTSIANSGHLSEFFNPTRGIRQGCPISANIFVTIVEILASAIRQNPKIIGIQIGDKMYKIAQYADDTVIYLTDLDSLKIVFTVLDLFKKCSGLKANRDKSEAIWIGASSNFKHKPMGIKWPETPIKCLGIYIQNDTSKLIDNNFNKCLEKIENILKIWNLRKMTLKGKIIIINTMIISQMIYLCTVLYTPQDIIDKYNKLITEFIWDKKPAKIKYTSLINNIDNGGLKLQDLDTKIKSLKLKWIKQILDETYSVPWKAYLQTHFKKVKLHKLITYNTNINDFPSMKDGFYNEMFKMWTKIHDNEVNNAEDICREVIWYNKHIKENLARKKYNEWEQKIKFIQDLLNNQGQLANSKELETKHNIPIDIMTLNSLLSTIPKKWKRLIKEDTNVNNYYVFPECKIIINKIKRSIDDVTTKELYSELIKGKALRPTSETKWQSEVGLNFDEDIWAIIYKLSYKVSRDTNIRAFHYKVTHRILASQKQLSIWKIKQTSICEHCKDEIEDIEHMLVACPDTLIFWNAVFEWWKASFSTFIQTDTYDIIFGMLNENDDDFITQYNYILLHGCHYIYKCKKKNRRTELYEFLLECKNKLKIEEEIYATNKKTENFEKKWANLYNNL
jgi:hypothetical protein